MPRVSAISWKAGPITIRLGFCCLASTMAPSTCRSGQPDLGDRKMSEGRALRSAADFRQNAEALGLGALCSAASNVIAAEVEQVVDLIVGREEALRLGGRFELFHLPLSTACRLV